MTKTNELVIAAGWTGELCLKGTRFKIGQGVGMSAHAAASGETFYAPDVKKIPFYVVGEEDTRSEIDIPLKVHGELIGVFNIQHTTMNAFSQDRIRLLEALAGHVATAIANARMFQRERLQKERMAKELEEARAIQTGLFPLKAPETCGFEIAGVCLPCREVGGDWYDYIPMAALEWCWAMFRVKAWEQRYLCRQPAAFCGCMLHVGCLLEKSCQRSTGFWSTTFLRIDL